MCHYPPSSSPLSVFLFTACSRCCMLPRSELAQGDSSESRGEVGKRFTATGVSVLRGEASPRGSLNTLKRARNVGEHDRHSLCVRVYVCGCNAVDGL